jgi:hypothetical protein
MTSPSLVTLRDLRRARMFPQELTGGKTPARRGACPQCAAPTSDVVITTGGPHADPAVWEAYPIAIDGWRCDRCEAMGFPVELSPEEITVLGNELGDSRAAAAPAAAPVRAPRKRVMPWHILALMLGAFGLVFSRGIATTGTFALAFPIISGLLVAWFVSRLLPIWVAAIVPVVVAIVAIVNVRNVAARHRAESEARLLDYAIADVCKAKPLNRDPSGRVRIRIFDAHDTPANFWHDWGGPKGEVPPYVLCIDHHREEVSCGEYVDQKHPDRGPTRICNARDIATVELRRAKTAEVVKSRTYRGGDPPPLTGYVQFGGTGSTRLGGGDVPYETIHPDFKSYFE